MNNDKFAQSLKYFTQHMKEFAEKTVKDFKPSKQQAKILEIIPKAIKENKSIAVKSGHGVGKTAIGAIIVLIFLTLYPDAKVIGTAPSKAQLLDVLWPEIYKWKKKYKFGELFVWTKTKIYHKEYPETWFASARTSNKPESMAGIHAKHVLIIMDEASGIPQEVYETMEGAETDKGALRILLSNPTKTTGEFYDAFHKNKTEYYTFTFSCLDSERVKKGYAEKIARKYGKDSNVYRVRVLGEFPKQEDDVIMSIELIERAHEKYMNDTKENLKLPEKMSIGIDAARYGDDESTVYSRINKIIKKEKIMRKKSITQIVGEITKIRKEKYKEIKKCIYNVDVTGVGAGVVDGLRENIETGILPKEDEVIEIANNMKSTKPKEYANIITELWFMFKKYLEEGYSLTPDDLDDQNNIQQQLCTRKYSITSKSQLIIEKKEDYKKRLKGMSPDRADGAILTIADDVIKGEIIVSDGINNKQVMKKEIQQFNTQKNIRERLKFYKQK